jgi:hypothetical protein
MGIQVPRAEQPSGNEELLMKRLPPVLPLILAMVAFLALAGIPLRAQDKPQASAKAPEMTPEQATDPTDPLFGVGPLPQGKISLVGGTIEKIDRVRDHIRVRPFGGGKKMNFVFDERTHIYRDGVETTERGLQRGDRVYVDTQLDGARLFARNIRAVTRLRPADARGQILAYDSKTGIMTVRDDLSDAPVTFRVTRETSVRGKDADSTIDLVPGSLVTVHFSPGRREQDVASEVSVLATPGNMFTFAGKVLFLDMRDGKIAVANESNKKTYELQFEPGAVGSDVMVGSEVVVKAEFIGRGYRVKTLTLSNLGQARSE